MIFPAFSSEIRIAVVYCSSLLRSDNEATAGYDPLPLVLTAELAPRSHSLPSENKLIASTIKHYCGSKVVVQRWIRKTRLLKAG